MSANPKFISLLRNLLEATEEGKLAWEETPNENTYRVFLDRAIVHISADSDEPFALVYYTASLKNPDGKELESLTVSRNEESDDWQLFADLYEAARRRAINVDGLLDGLIESVKKKR